MALKPRRGTWAYGDDAHTPVDAARELAWNGPDDPGDWHPVTRTFRDGHTETWYAADATLGWWGRTAPGAWWSPPPTRPPCRAKPPGTWSPTCPGPAERARLTARTRPRPWPRSCGSTASATGRAELQTGQGRAGLGRLPGPLRHRDPPPPGAGQLRVQLLLGRLVPRSPGTASACGTAARTRPRREGGRARPSPRQRRRGRGHCAQYAPGFPPGSPCNAGGRHGPQRPRRRSCRP